MVSFEIWVKILIPDMAIGSTHSITSEVHAMSLGLLHCNFIVFVHMYTYMYTQELHKYIQAHTET